MEIAPALVTGNTVIVKPSPFTPLTTLRIGELLQDVLPPGVLNVVSGDDSLGPLMTAHDDIDKIAFTGSTATGRRVMAGAAGTLKRITLELGGNDAAIVLPDIDVKAVVPSIFWACFANSSQYCLATKRLYVHEDIYEELTVALAEFANTVVVGNGLDEGVQLGPVQNLAQYDKVTELIEECHTAGLTFILGGEKLDGTGYFIAPAIVDNPPDNSRVVTEEPFGPILPVLKFVDVDEVVSRANDSEYGLGASVWSSDTEAALAVGERLDTGMVWINQMQRLTPFTPLSGHKQSGIGAENGIDGLLAYTSPQTVSVKR